MFKVRKEQVTLLDECAFEDFYGRLAIFLREEMPEETSHYNDQGLLEYIRESRCRALSRGIETERGVAQWTCLSLVFGHDFDEIPEISEYFELTEMAPEDKLKILVDCLYTFECRGNTTPDEFVAYLFR